MDLELGLRWRITFDAKTFEIDELLFALLEDIRAGGNLNFAAKNQCVSYRHAWGLLREWEQRFGSALVVARQGRGARLTNFGASLLAVRVQATSNLKAGLERNALRASADLEAAIADDRHRVRIASSHDERMIRLRDRLEADRRDVSLEIVGSEGALKNYRRGDADIAGFHLPMGELGRTVAAKLLAVLDDKHDQIHLIEKRFLGLMARPDAPCRSIADLITTRRRFVNRQPGSATRLSFDGLLGMQGIAPGDVAGYHDEEYTHTAVAARVVSRDADVAFGSQSAAAHFSLEFEAMVEERFYLAISRNFDNRARQLVADYCASLEFENAARMKADEFNPTVAVLKRVHRAGFWKTN